METGSVRQIDDMIAELVTTPGKYQLDGVISLAMHLAGLNDINRLKNSTLKVENARKKGLSADRASEILYSRQPDGERPASLVLRGGRFSLDAANSPFPAQLFEDILKDYKSGNKTALEFLDIFVDRLTKIDFSLRENLGISVNPYVASDSSSYAILDDILTVKEPFTKMPKEFSYLDFNNLSNFAFREPISGLVLKRILEALFICSVTVVQNTLSHLRIPEESQLKLSRSGKKVLGKTTFLGRLSASAESSLEIQVNDFACPDLARLVSEPTFVENLKILFRSLCNKPLSVTLVLKKHLGEGFKLGSHNQLGRNIWLNAESNYEPATIRLNSWEISDG